MQHPLSCFHGGVCDPFFVLHGPAFVGGIQTFKDTKDLQPAYRKKSFRCQEEYIKDEMKNLKREMIRAQEALAGPPQRYEKSHEY